MKNKKEGGVHDVTKKVAMQEVTGKVTKMFEGENALEYSFSIPEGATTTVDMDGARVRVMKDDAMIASFYFSYEGGRGYSALDYITNVMTPRVPTTAQTSTSTVGMYVWQGAESKVTEWQLASVLSNAWLVLVESSKENHDVVTSILESVSVK